MGEHIIISRGTIHLNPEGIEFSLPLDPDVIRKEMEIINNSPPAPEPMRYREIHGLEHCPGCSNMIHISGGNFYNADECPDHTRNQPTKPIEGKRGRPNKTKMFPCPICKGRQKVPASLYGTKDTSDTAETQCKSCHGLGYVVAGKE